MYLSIAYPTSTPLGGSMTADRAATIGPVPAQSEDVTDISSKGLLPQLIDVLRALTEGQELLARKVRDARLEHSDHMTPLVEGSPLPEPSDFAGPRLLVGSSPTPSIGTLREPPSEHVELGALQTSINGFTNGSSSEPGIGSSAAPAPGAVSDTVSPSNPPAAIVTHAGTPTDPSSETSARTDWLNSVPSDESTTAPSNRDYNFFDALDARLADLHNGHDGADPTGDS